MKTIHLIRLSLPLLLILILTNCRSKTKQVLKRIEKQTETNFQKIDSNFVLNQTKRNNIKEDVKVQKDQSLNNGSVIIKGKVDTISKDFKYDNIVDGDTISSIFIKGNATFEIKNNWNKKKEKVDSVKTSESTNFVSEVSRAIVSKKNIKEVAKKINETEKKVKENGFTFPIYLIIGIVLLVAVVLIIIIKNFKK